MRGSPLRPSHDRRGDGSIPACAGQPYPRCPQSSEGRVYPRVCGAAAQEHEAVRPRSGLSPRVRGSPGSKSTGSGGAGSIPACAGQPSYDNLVKLVMEVYPRVCGAAPCPRRIQAQHPGLSPRVRGSLGFVWQRRPVSRSIPACAGQPGTMGSWRGRLRVYPRVCGAATSISSRCSWSSGLSPRVRGSRRFRKDCKG